MKFKSTDDKKMFLLEMSRIDLLPSVSVEWEPDRELVELFIQKRGELTKSVKDFRKSQNTKSQWRKHRHKIMRGIKNFHRSTKGKQFHRSLGKFIATRFTGDSPLAYYRDKENTQEESLTVFESLSTLKGISSLRTHLYIESEYFMPFSEYVEFLELSDEVLESSFIVEKKLLRYDTEIDEQEVDILGRVVTPRVLLDCLADVVLGPTNPILAEQFDKMTKTFEHKLDFGSTLFESMKDAWDDK